MPHILHTETIVLKTHDVGEADRFCILFTRERGKVTARVRGARKLGSKLGGHLLPMNHVQLHMKQGSAGYTITDAVRLSVWNPRNLSAFLYAEHGIELLLTTVHDEEPLPEIFDATLQFLAECDSGAPHPVLPFTIRLLHMYGLLPQKNDAYFAGCSEEAKNYIELSASGVWKELPTLTDKDRYRFSGLLAGLLSHITNAPLKSGIIVGEMEGVRIK